MLGPGGGQARAAEGLGSNLPELSEEAGVASSPDDSTSLRGTAAPAAVEAPNVEAVAQAAPAPEPEGCLVKGQTSLSPTWRGQAPAVAVGSAMSRSTLEEKVADSPSTTRGTR